MLQFITSCCSYRDDREYHRKTQVNVFEVGSYKDFHKPEVSLSDFLFHAWPESA